MKITSLKLYFIVSFACLVLSVRMYAQQVNFHPMLFIDQMPTNAIFNLFQDKSGFMWIATANGVVRYDGYETRIFRNNFLTPDELKNNDVRCFAESESYIWVGTTQGITLINKTTFQSQAFVSDEFEEQLILDMMNDNEGNVWICTDYKVYRCNPQGELVKTYTFPISVNRVYEDRDGILWLLSTRGSIFRYDNRHDCFNQYAELVGCNLYQMTQDKQGIFWIATWGNGIWRFDPLAADESQMFRKQSLVNPVRNLPETTFYDIVQDDSYGYIWALSHFKLYILTINENGDLEEVDDLLFSQGHFRADFHKTYSRVIKDKRGNLWLGAYDQGYIVSFKDDNIKNYVLDDIPKNVGLDANIIYFDKDQSDIIWFNQARYGLCLYDEQSGNITYGIGRGDNLYSMDVLSIVPSKKDNVVWLGGRLDFSTKVWKMSQKKMQISILEEYDLRTVTQNPGIVTQLAEDFEGNVWIGTSRHLFYKQYGSSQIELTSLPVSDVVDLATDKLGYLWVCIGQEIYKIKCNGNYSIEEHYSASSLFLENNETIKNCCVNHKGQCWFTTSLGRIYMLDSQTDTIVEETNVYDLKGDEILKILMSKGQLWIVCHKYVICHDLNENKNTYYPVNDENISISSIRYGAAFIDRLGNLYAGGHKGFLKIIVGKEPNRHVLDEEKVYITDVRTDGRSVLFSPVDKERDNSISDIKLLPNARNIEILFSSFPYESRRHVKYAYKMEGVDNSWVYIDNNVHGAFYNRLPKGEYTFKVRTTDINGHWIDGYQEVRIQSLPMWYETIWAYIVYLLLAIVTVFLIFYLYARYINRKNQIKLQEELTQIKLNYFTGISHELFSPLATIACTTDVLEQEKMYQQSQIDILRANIDRLKRLLQQILDFRKVESGKMTLLIEKGNITERIQGIIASNFQPQAHRKHIRLSSQIEEGIWGYLDFDKLDKILFNLLSNAIKYTPEYKQVKVIMKVVNKNGWRYLNVAVIDEGIGIEPKELKYIFTKFYNNKRSDRKETNGLGLSLTKDLITIHHGTIEVESTLNEGSTFTIELPIDKETYSEDELFISIDSHQEEPEALGKEEIPHLLFVDDNPELRLLMEKLFAKQFRVSTVEEGQKGLEILKNTSVDLVICDVMMPGMDGLEFCSTLKRNQQTSHIPIIMLTAKNGVNAQIECYQAGAESFIAKPFDMKVLQARIENLLQMAKNRQQNFQSQYDVDISDLEYQMFDEDFLQNAISCVEKHIQDSDFDIESLAMELGMSRSTLSRKLKALTGMTPLDFIRNIKLKYACRLLKNKSANISDVAYYLGFSSLKYFTKCFKKEFGMTPSEYKEKLASDNS